VTHPLLPVPLSQLPATFNGVRFGSSAQVFDAVCGGAPDLEGALREHDPNERARDIGRALFRADAARAAVRCRRALQAALAEAPVVRRVYLALEDGTTEGVSFFTLPIAKLPATAPGAHEVSDLQGLRDGRCFSFYVFPDRPCDELSDSIARWPTGDLWIAGRMRGVQRVAAALRSTLPHRAAHRVQALLAAGEGLTIDSLTLHSRDVHALSLVSFQETLSGAVGVVEGHDREGRRVVRLVTEDPSDAGKIEAELRRELEQFVSPFPVPSERDAAPALRKALTALAMARANQEVRVHERRSSAVELGREGRIVTRRSPVSQDDAAVVKAERGLAEAEAKQATKIRRLVDGWLGGGRITKADLTAIGGAAFARAVHEYLQ
jgi:hypothetical protein